MFVYNKNGNFISALENVLIFSCAATQHAIMFFLCVFVFCMSHPTYGYGYMNLSHTRPILTKCDHPISIQANQNQTKLKQTKKDHTKTLVSDAQLLHRSVLFISISILADESCHRECLGVNAAVRGCGTKVEVRTRAASVPCPDHGLRRCHAGGGDAGGHRAGSARQLLQSSLSTKCIYFISV